MDKFSYLLGHVADGLSHLHRHRVLHLDLHPYNVLVQAGSKGYIAKICDLTTSVALEDWSTSPREQGLAQSHDSVPGWRAPEQEDPCFGRVKPSADAFNYGQLVFYLHCKKTPEFERPGEPALEELFQTDLAAAHLASVLLTEPHPRQRPGMAYVAQHPFLYNDHQRRHIVQAFMFDDTDEMEPKMARQINAFAQAFLHTPLSDISAENEENDFLDLVNSRSDDVAQQFERGANGKAVALYLFHYLEAVGKQRSVPVFSAFRDPSDADAFRNALERGGPMDADKFRNDFSQRIRYSSSATNITKKGKALPSTSLAIARITMWKMLSRK